MSAVQQQQYPPQQQNQTAYVPVGAGPVYEEATYGCACLFLWFTSFICNVGHRCLYLKTLENDGCRIVTCNYCGIGWFIDCCTMQSLVDQENAGRRQIAMGGAPQVVVMQGGGSPVQQQQYQQPPPQQQQYQQPPPQQYQQPQQQQYQQPPPQGYPQQQYQQPPPQQQQNVYQ